MKLGKSLKMLASVLVCVTYSVIQPGNLKADVSEESTLNHSMCERCGMNSCSGKRIPAITVMKSKTN